MQHFCALEEYAVFSESLLQAAPLLLVELSLSPPCCSSSGFNVSHSKSFGINIQPSCRGESIIEEEEISISLPSKGARPQSLFGPHVHGLVGGTDM